MKRIITGAVLAAGVLLGTGAAAVAQDAAFMGGETQVAAPGGEDWGIAQNIIETYEASDFEIFNGAYGGIDGNAARFCGNAAACGWFTSVRLPTGALVSAIELDACDTDAANQLAFALFRNVKAGGATTNLNGALIATGASPGCTVFTGTLTTPETINNLNNNYFIDVVSGPTANTRFKAVRVIYKLQVSAAPATATFPTDVPTTHPFFRFVEALARAGISGGCAAGSFCPDTPVTRGQMAVFLATALGLHFPN